MHVILVPLFLVLDIALGIFTWVLIISAILSWLVAFNVVNTRNRFVYTVLDMLSRLTEPALRPIRRMLPQISGIDLSPVVLILILIFLRSMLFELRLSLVM